MSLVEPIKALQLQVQEAITKLDLSSKSKELKGLKPLAEAADFWQDAKAAATTMQSINNLEELINPWFRLRDEVNDILQLAELQDPSLEPDIKSQVAVLEKQFEGLKSQLRLSGPFDGHDAILSIHAGAGGTDAQDWADMLRRMYVRWGETAKFKVTQIDESAGEEAGIKSVSIEFAGSFAYGKLKGEHGVHRLVRLSPFNADAKRQTSFVKVEVLPKINAPEDVPIDESDLKIDVFRSGGKGGQSVNTTDSAVRVTHLPTGIVVSIQNERSQLQNKETALTILRSKLAQLQMEQHLESLAEIKGPNQSAEWGNQIRSYVLHPYTMVKDLRTRHETTNADGVLNGDLDPFIDAYLEFNT